MNLDTLVGNITPWVALVLIVLIIIFYLKHKSSDPNKQPGKAETASTLVLGILLFVAIFVMIIAAYIIYILTSFGISPTWL